MLTRRKIRGLSLLELLVAVGVFAVAFVMLLTVFPTAARAVRQGEQYLNATFLAERRLEEVRALDFDTVADADSTETMGTTNLGVSSSVAYTVQTRVSLTETNLKRVRVLVSWTGDRARHVEVLTDVARLR